MNHLKSLIEQEFISLNDNVECRSVANRCQMCINTEGKQRVSLGMSLWI
jgi:hypothetical protein